MSDSGVNLGQPASYVTLEEGAPVYTCDGEKVGKVTKVIADSNLDIFDGLEVSTGALATSEGYLAAEQVEEIFERGVLLKIDAAAAKNLPAPDRNSGSL